MSRFINDSATQDKMREVLDWSVFALGVLSLTIALGATVVTKTNLFASNDVEPQVIIAG